MPATEDDEIDPDEADDPGAGNITDVPHDDDDPAGGNLTDEPHDDDGSVDAEPDDTAARRPHRDRIRRTRCRVRTYRDFYGRTSVRGYDFTREPGAGVMRPN